MQQASQGLEPNSIWKHFDRIAAIPRAPTKEAVIRQYVLDETARLGLTACNMLWAISNTGVLEKLRLRYF